MPLLRRGADGGAEAIAGIGSRRQVLSSEVIALRNPFNVLCPGFCSKPRVEFRPAPPCVGCADRDRECAALSDNDDEDAFAGVAALLMAVTVPRSPLNTSLS